MCWCQTHVGEPERETRGKHVLVENMQQTRVKHVLVENTKHVANTLKARVGGKHV